MAIRSFFSPQAATAETDARWLVRFHDGDRTTLERCYREHSAGVLAAASRLLRDVDAETVTHEIFFRLLTDGSMRAGFRGGDLGAWLSVVARRRAIDWLRRMKREVSARGSDPELAEPGPDRAREDDAVDAKRLVARFQSEVLPDKYRALFQARFLRQLSQREAAAELGIERSTLAYQEQRVRELLERFILEGGER